MADTRGELISSFNLSEDEVDELILLCLDNHKVEASKKLRWQYGGSHQNPGTRLGLKESILVLDDLISEYNE